MSPKRCENVVLACVVLHNFLRNRHPATQYAAENDPRCPETMHGLDPSAKNRSAQDPRDMRDLLSDYLRQNPISSP